jgi:glycosyltransferase involved in cell wall biosynthesis
LPDRPTSDGPVRILHAHSTFSLGGKEARAVRLMNAFGDHAEHAIWSAMPDQLAAREAIAPGIRAEFPADAPPLAGRPTPARLRRLAAFMRGFDLVLTYNWGAFDAVMARRLWGGPPLVHHEDGFNEDEAHRLKPVRNLYRRLGLPAADALVVPSRRLEQIALTRWGQPRERLVRIPNGIKVQRFAGPSTRPIPGLAEGSGAVIGTVAGLRAVKNLPRLVRAFAAAAPPEARLVIVGEGPERGRIEEEAARQGVAERLVLPGFMADPAAWIGHFDVFALSSDSEQFPISLVEAMAAGLPCISTDVGDVAGMVAPENCFAIGGETVLAAALARFLADPGLRRAVGEANRRLAAEAYDEGVMISRYATLYAEAIGRPGALGSSATVS